MKPYMNLNGKGKWSNFWGDKVKRNFKRIFKKSIRSLNKKYLKSI